MRAALFFAGVCLVLFTLAGMASGLTYTLPVPYHTQGNGFWPPDPGYPPAPNNWCTVACLHMLFEYYEFFPNQTGIYGLFPAQEIANVCNTDDVAGVAGGWAGTMLDDARRACHYSCASVAALSPPNAEYTWRRYGLSAVEDYTSLMSWPPQVWIETLNQGYPVIFNTYFPFTGTPPDGSDITEPPPATEIGHSILLIGYDTDTQMFIFHDPWYGPFVRYPWALFDLTSPDCPWRSGSYLFSAPFDINVFYPETVFVDSTFDIRIEVNYTVPKIGRAAFYNPTTPPYFPVKFPISMDIKPINTPFGFVLNSLNYAAGSPVVDSTGGARTFWLNFTAPSEPRNYCGFSFLAYGQVSDMSTSYPAYTDTLGTYYCGVCITVIEATDIKEQGKVTPEELNFSVYPNPANATVQLTFEATENTEVEIELYNISGEKVRRLFRSSVSPGRYDISWDGRDDNGVACPSGVYSAVLRTSSGKTAKRVVVLK